MVGSHESGHVPVGQLEPDDDESPDRAANVENIFSVSSEPHFSQRCGALAPAFSRNELT